MHSSLWFEDCLCGLYWVLLFNNDNACVVHRHAKKGIKGDLGGSTVILEGLASLRVQRSPDWKAVGLGGLTHPIWLVLSDISSSLRTLVDSWTRLRNFCGQKGKGMNKADVYQWSACEIEQKCAVKLTLIHQLFPNKPIPQSPIRVCRLSLIQGLAAVSAKLWGKWTSFKDWRHFWIRGETSLIFKKETSCHLTNLAHVTSTTFIKD